MVGRFTQQVVSRPVWGAWIEISCTATPSPNDYSRVWGAWIEIFPFNRSPSANTCRAPYGARGLKLIDKHDAPMDDVVAPRMGRVD